MLALLATALIGTYSGHPVLVTGRTPLQATLQASALPGNGAHFEIREQANGTTVRAYDLNMTKRLHLILVSDDMRTFRHLHPTLHPDGRFTLDVAPAPAGLYHVYIDGDPHGSGRQVFRFDVPLGSAKPAAVRVANPPGATAHAGPYEVRLDRTTVDPGDITTIHVTILKNGRPAPDLHPYLGGMAHGVFIGMRDLAYMHTHGMSAEMLAMSDQSDCGDSMMTTMPALAPNASVPPAFLLQVLAPSAQPYDFWLQFRGGSTVYTVPFLVSASP